MLDESIILSTAMSLSYVIHKEQRLVLTVGRGHVTLEEFTAHRKRLLRDPNFNPDFNQMNDHTAVVSTNLTGAKLSWFASNPVFSQSSRRAVVVSRPAHFGMARQFASYHDNRAGVNVFYDWNAALKWLGLHDISCALPGRTSGT